MPTKNVIKVLGVPGAGKTTKCYEIIMNFINSGNYKIEDICFTSFTKAAIESIKEKFLINNICINKNINFKTLNSLTWKLSGFKKEEILQNEAVIAYFKENKLTFSFFKEKSKKKNVKTDLDFVIEVYNFIAIGTLTDPSTASDKIIKDYISIYLIENSLFYVQVFLEYAIDMFKKFCVWKNQHGKKLYIDSLLKVFNDKINIEEKILIVDEAQDLNNLQKKIIEIWTDYYKRDFFILAGDPAQSVHCWANADPSYLIDYIRPNIYVIKLEKTHRLPRNIAALCNNIMNYIEKKDDKIIESEKEDGVIRYLSVSYINLIKQLNKIKEHNKLTKTFLLFRTNALMYKFATLFFCNSNIKFDFIDKGVNRYWTNKFIKCYNALNKISADKPISKSEFKLIVSLIDSNRVLETNSYKETITSLEIAEFFNIDYKENLLNFDKKDNIYKDIKNKLIDKLKFSNFDNINGLYKTKLRTGLDIVSCSITKNEINFNVNVSLGTYHASKGLEADNVFVFLGSSYIFSQIDDSELRCLFTAASRAKKKLYFIASQDEDKSLEDYFLKIYKDYNSGDKNDKK